MCRNLWVRRKSTSRPALSRISSRPAQLAKGKMRAKIADLSMALEGRFGDHHALMCRLHLDHTGHLEAMIATLDAQIEAMMTPFQCWRDLLATIPGIGQLSAAAVISEIGTDVTAFFPCDARLASWTALCPGTCESAGKRCKGNPHLQSILVECPGPPSATTATCDPSTTGT